MKPIFRRSVPCSRVGSSFVNVQPACRLSHSVAATAAALLSTFVIPHACAGLQNILIEYGWDVPTPAQMQQELAAMEKRPFDGLIFRLAGGHNAFALEPLILSRCQVDTNNPRPACKTPQAFVVSTQPSEPGFQLPNDALQTVEYPIGELLFPQLIPDMFLRIQFR